MFYIEYYGSDLYSKYILNRNYIFIIVMLSRMEHDGSLCENNRDPFMMSALINRSTSILFRSAPSAYKPFH